MQAPLPARAAWWLPTPPDVLFAAILSWLFVLSSGGWSLLLADGDTGWHIRTGEWILANRQVPHVDLFSFSKPQQPWFAWEWLADVLFAWIHAWGGLAWLAFFSGTLLVGTTIVLLRYLSWRGCAPVVVFPLILCSVGASTVHYLARPHIFTLLFIAITMWILDAHRRNPSRRIWVLVPITVLWTNLHGGWPALLVFLSIQVAVHLWHGEELWKEEAFVTIGCLLATLINPYGWHLHEHILGYLRSDWIRETVDEFQSPKFRSENLLQYELILLLGVGAAWSSWKRGSAGQIEALGVLVWAHFSLSAVRHIPIYVLAAVPVLATELTQIVSAAWANSKKSSLPGIFRDIDRDLRPKFGANSIWALVFPLLIWWSSAAKWPTDFPADRFPVTALESAGKALEGKRVFMSDQWGDYFIYRQWPASLAYLDGRSDFYGREIGGEALAIASGAGDWERKLESRGIAFALLPTGSPLSQAMLRSRWEVLHKDGLAIVLRRPGRGAPAQ